MEGVNQILIAIITLYVIKLLYNQYYNSSNAYQRQLEENFLRTNHAIRQQEQQKDHQEKRLLNLQAEASKLGVGSDLTGGLFNKKVVSDGYSTNTYSEVDPAASSMFPTAIHVGNVAKQQEYNKIAEKHGILQAENSFKNNLLNAAGSGLKNTYGRYNNPTPNSVSARNQNINSNLNVQTQSPQYHPANHLALLEEYGKLEHENEFSNVFGDSNQNLNQNSEPPRQSKAKKWDPDFVPPKKCKAKSQGIKLGSWKFEEEDEDLEECDTSAGISITKAEFNKMSRERQRNVLAQKKKELERNMLKQKAELEAKLKKINGISDDEDENQVIIGKAGSLKNKPKTVISKTETLPNFDFMKPKPTARPVAVTDPPVEYMSPEYQMMYDHVIEQQEQRQAQLRKVCKHEYKMYKRVVCGPGLPPEIDPWIMPVVLR